MRFMNLHGNEIIFKNHFWLTNEENIFQGVGENNVSL